MVDRNNEAVQGKPLATEPPGERRAVGKRVLTRRRFIQAALGGVAGTLAYAALVEPFWLEIVHQRLSFSRLPPGLRGLRLVQLSDLHISHVISESYLLMSFVRIAALQPDVVVYTGDFMTRSPDTRARLGRLFPQLPKGRLATLGILGNHDYGNAWREPEWADAIVRLAADSGMRIFRNETARVNDLQIVGIDGLWAGRSDPAKALLGVDPTMPTIVLSARESASAGAWSQRRSRYHTAFCDSRPARMRSSAPSPSRSAVLRS